MSIHILTKDITQKIAAGEVVERPASVVKELIENAIDAEAKSITVEIENGGTTYIRVTDNGCGMDENDSLLSFKTHATSKIQNEEDLFNIVTLGFRGEAIPSISAVSKMTMFTRTANSEFAMKIVNHGGEIISTEKCGRPEGTTIIVEDIFYNVPARLKFLKKPSAETAQISNIIQKYVLARPDISFRFISGGKDVYFSNGNGSLKDAIYVIYGQDIYTNLIPLSFESNYVKIDGFIGDPSIARASKHMQNLFVNGRYIRSEIISNSIKQGYLNRIMPAKHPFYALTLSIPYNEIDVNVHPNKLDVRFKEEGFIQECFFKAVKQSFELYGANISSDDAFADRVINTKKTFEQVSSSATIEKNNREAMTRSLVDIVNSKVISPEPFKKPQNILGQSSFILKDTVTPLSVNENFVYSNSRSELNEEKTVTVITDLKSKNTLLDKKSQTELQLDLSETIGDYNIIGQIFNTYLLVEYKDTMLLIDQHAAHERINTNKMMKEFEESRILKQKLLLPFVIQLTSADYNAVMDSCELFEQLGFEIEEFGNNVIRINTVPHIFGEENIESFFFETLDALKDNPKMDTRKHIIFDTACKHSIKAGQRLNDDEIKELINISIKDKTPLNCPHGRPIVIIKTKKEIEKWFMRIV